MRHEQDVRQRVVAAYDAISRGDVEPLLSMLASDVVWRYAAPPDQLPYGGSHVGPEAVRRFFETVGATFTFEEFSFDRFLADGATVVVIGRERARSNATGLVYDTPLAHVYEFNDEGHVAGFTELVDSASVVGATGHPDR